MVERIGARSQRPWSAAAAALFRLAAADAADFFIAAAAPPAARVEPRSLLPAFTAFLVGRHNTSLVCLSEPRWLRCI